MRKVNSFAGPCIICNTPVAKGEGFLATKNKKLCIFCKDHVPEETAKKPVSLIPTGKTNSYQAPCETCNIGLLPGKGVLYKKGESWVVFCKDHAPRRQLTKEGRVYIPNEPENLPLLRSFPGSYYDPIGNFWLVSTKSEDRRRVLEIADRLFLDVDPEFREIQLTKRGEKAQAEGLYPYQVIGVDFLAGHPSAILGDDMGLGKTIQTLVAMLGRVLVVCPAGVRYVWKKETAKWRPDIKITVIQDSKQFRLPQAGEIVVCNYENLPNWLLPKDFGKRDEKGKVIKEVKLPQKFSEDASIVTLVVDEAHYVKHPTTQRAKKVKSLAKVCSRVWGLTGTIFETDPLDLWGVLRVLGMERTVFGNWKRFLQLFKAERGKFGAYEWSTPDPSVPELLRRVMLRRTRQEVLPDLPKITYQTLMVEDIPAQLKRSLNNIQKELWSDLDPDWIEELPPFDKIATARREIAEGRIPAMLDYVASAEGQNTPLIVFSAHRAPIDTLTKRDGWLTITGDDSHDSRAFKMQQFEAGYFMDELGNPLGGKKIPVLGMGLTIGAGGVGLTLVKIGNRPVSTCLFVDLDWTPAKNAQAIARLCRIGQEADKILCVYMMSNHPVDRRLQELLAIKTLRTYESVEKLHTATIRPIGEESEEDARMRYAAEEAERLEKVARKQRMKERVPLLLEREMAKSPKYAEMELTSERRNAIREALGYMVSVCDGAVAQDKRGFDRVDATIAHMLRDTDMETDAELKTVWYMLTRYHRQIEGKYPVLFNN